MFFDDEPLQLTPKAAKKPLSLKMLDYPPKKRKFLTGAEIQDLPIGSDVVFDSELFANYYLAAFKHIDTGGYFYLTATPERPLAADALNYVMWRFKLITFNGIHYDIPIACAAIKGADVAGLKDLSDAIIFRGELMDRRAQPPINHVDVIEVTPLQGSQKLYAARLHAPRLQEMPVSIAGDLSPLEIQKATEYCFNDLDCLELIYREVKDQITMREQIGASINEDLRSKSDAQIAEAVFKAEYRKITGSYPKAEGIDKHEIFYKPPSYLNFKTPALQQVRNMLARTTFEIDANGYVRLPKSINGLTLPIGNQIYRMSIGGLHSSETCLSARSNISTAISDFDVASYYPKIILNSGLCPPSMDDKNENANGKPFLLIYNGLVVRRLSAKDAGRMIESDGLKITVNGTFGKTGNPYSIMYCPELMLYTTLTGQLTLLYAIEPAATAGFEVLSANTDGIVFRYPREREAELKDIIGMWEQETNFKLEKTSYAGYFARDVNNYMTLKENGEWKLKGAYSEKGSAQNSVLSRNPENFICVDAAKSFIANNMPIAQTIRGCNDWRRFVQVRNVKGGAHKDGIYLGKVVRWYHGKDARGEINYVRNGNKVPNSEGAVPFMEATQFPTDIDYEWYEKEALAILHDIGYLSTDKQQKFFG